MTLAEELGRHDFARREGVFHAAAVTDLIRVADIAPQKSYGPWRDKKHPGFACRLIVSLTRFLAPMRFLLGASSSIRRKVRAGRFHGIRTPR